MSGARFVDLTEKKGSAMFLQRGEGEPLPGRMEPPAAEYKLVGRYGQSQVGAGKKPSSGDMGPGPPAQWPPQAP